MLSQLKFLLVDDQPAVRAIVAAILRSAGAETIDYASDGGSALEVVGSRVPDIVITDMHMSGLDGLDLVKLLRGAPDTPNPFVPIIMLTARTDAAFVQEARDAGVTEFASKPMSAATLLSRIDSIVLKPRPFVRNQTYFGPCRRRRVDSQREHVKRRASDAAEA